MRRALAGPKTVSRALSGRPALSRPRWRRVSSRLRARAWAQVAACGLAAALAAAPAGAPSIDSAVDGLSAARMQADVTFLSSRPLAGRLSGRPGDDAAAEFLAAELSKAGVPPVAGSYFQTIPLVEFAVDGEHSSLAWAARGTAQGAADVERTLHPQGNFSCRFPESARISAGVVFAGYGITAPELHYDDYADVDVRGKWALVLAGEPQRDDPDSVFNGRGDTIHAGSRVKPLEAQKHGAIGLLVVGGRMGSLVRANSGGAVRSRLPSQALADSRFRIPVVTMTVGAGEELLRAAGKERSDLVKKIDATLRPQSFELSGVRVTLDHRVARAERVNSSNVAGWIEGSDPALRGETVILSGHHDHLGSVGDAYFPGANDNASGAAAVVELARAFAASGLKPRRSILFIVFGSEEEGLLGSFHYVEHPLRPIEQTVAVVNLDMIGQNETPSPQTDGRWHVPLDTTNAVDPIGTHYAPDLRRLIETENERVGLKLDFRLDADHSLDVFQRCDHYPFALEHIPAVWLFAGFHPEYHQTTDTVDRLNFPKMLKITKLAMRLVWELANGSARPQWLATPGPVKGTA